MQRWGTSFILVTSSSRPCVSLGKSLLCLHAGQARNTGKSTRPPAPGKSQPMADGSWWINMPAPLLSVGQWQGAFYRVSQSHQRN